jgi:hypothetical protein
MVIQALPHTLGAGPEVCRVLFKCHDIRNRGEYEVNPVLGQPGQHGPLQRRLRLLRESLGVRVHTQDRPGPRRGDQMLLDPPVGGAERRLLLLARAHGRHEDDVLDARPHGCVESSDILRAAPSGFRIDGRENEQTIEARMGLRKAFGLVLVPEASLSRPRDGFGPARDRHHLVPARTLQQFRNDGPAQMAAGATHTDRHVSLHYFQAAAGIAKLVWAQVANLVGWRPATVLASVIASRESAPR